MALAWVFLAGQPAPAEPVSARTAAGAVQGWLRLDHQPLGQRLPAKIRHTQTVKNAAGAALYHVVELDPAGYVIVAGDDSVEPIIAFSAAGRFVATSDDPLAVLVNRDLPRRMARIRAGPRDARAVEAHRRWRGVLAASPDPPSDGEQNGNIVIASQVWVAPFVQTLWNQTTDVSEQEACYNYYTPPYGPGNVNNLYCGCVATCLAQLMYYYKYPTTGVGTNSFPITVLGGVQNANLRGGDGLGGAYAWANMPLAPNAPTTAQAQAIGALCFDAGLTVEMDYETNGSSAFTYLAQQALTNTFKFSNAGFDEDDANGLSGPSFLAMLNPNVDARLPVALGIDGPDGGHCLLCDGYGYSGPTLFHHLNPGWGGDDDVWYALPNINTPDGNDDYTIVNACIYNIYATGSGQIISGRVTDPTGAPVAGAGVTATRSGGGVYTATTDSNGVYALARIPANSQYALTVTNTGDVPAGGNYSTGLSTFRTTTSGNVWGANFTLAPPLLAMPEAGFAAVGPVAGPFGVASQSYTLTNTTASALSWSLANTSAWLSVTASNGLVPAGAASSLTVSLNAAANGLAAGNYSATVFLTNLNNHLAQALAFSLSVMTADYPIAVTGFNADVVVENDAVGGNALLYAQPFDPAIALSEPVSPAAFYQAGLAAANLYGGTAVKGLPQSGLFTSVADHARTFQLGPYGSNNVLYLVAGSNAGALSLTSPAAYQSLSVLAASAQGGGSGSLALHFTDGSASSSLAFQAPNYLATNAAGTGAALTGFGILLAGIYNEFYTLDTNQVFPALYQTSINLRSLGLHTKAISAVTFTMPGGANTNLVTGIFALSGTQSAFPVISSQPQSVAVAGGANVTLSVGVAGAGPLSYRWYFNGSSLAGAQSNPLNLASVGVADAGSYQVVVTNTAGAVTSAPAVVSITNAPVLFLTGGSALKLSGGKLTLQLTNLTGQGQVVISASTNLLQWAPIFTNPSGFGSFTVTDAAAGAFPSRYYRATTP